MMPSTSSSASKRFELPQLTPVNYSLTDGTDIPPPPASPIRETPPPPKPIQQPQPQVTDPPTPTTSTNGETFEPRGRTQNQASHVIPPLSPASTTQTTRPGSIRRFLSRRSLHSGYTNGTNKSVDDLSQYSTSNTTVEGAGNRPNTGLETGPRPKRSTSWFRRLGGSGSTDGHGKGSAGTRTSVVYEEKEKVEKKGPPPPTLPELRIGGRGSNGKGDDGGLGGEDMFKNIR